MRNFSAYKNDPELRDAFIAQLQSHQDQDQIIQGQYGQGANGDFRGCAIHSLAKIRGEELYPGNHQLLEDLIDYPIELVFLIDGIFEGLPTDIAKGFPLRIGKAVRTGADLKMIVPQFLFWILSDDKEGVLTRFDRSAYPGIVAAVRQVVELFKNHLAGQIITEAAWGAAWGAAVSAARRSAWSATWSALAIDSSSAACLRRGGRCW